MPDETAPLTPSELQNVARFIARRDRYGYTPVVWFDEPDAALYHRAEKLGVLSGQSATQIHWTEAGIEAFRAAVRPVVKHAGWDGRSNPFYEQRSACGCRWTENGAARLAACSDAIAGQCEARPGEFEGRRDVYDADGTFWVMTVDDRFGWVGDAASGTLLCRWPHCHAQIRTKTNEADATADDHWKGHTR